MIRHLSAALFLFVVTSCAWADEPETFDRWYVLQMQGQRAGWAHMTQTTEGERITSTNEMQIALKRGPIAVEIQQKQAFTETADAKPVEATSTVKMGAMAMTSAYRFTDEGIEVTSGQGGQTQKRVMPKIAGEWLTPAAAQRYVEAQIAGGAKEIKLRTLDLSLGIQPIEATMKVIGEEKVEVLGKTVPAIAWEATLPSMPGITMREYVDLDGRTLKTTVKLMEGMELEMLAADEALAKSPVDAPEVLASLLIHPTGKPLGDARAATSAVYEVALKPNSGIEKLDLPRAGFQRVVFGDAGTARVVVDLDEPVAPERDLPTAEHLASSAMLNHEDEAVVSLVAKAMPENARLTREGVALRLRTFVHDHLAKKSLAVGFGTASEVARTGEGDCSEHAVLLAALLRGAGIPSRVATGLVYVDEFVGAQNVFGGHMWSQAWIEDVQGGRWIDLDATLPEAEGRGFDAGHITLGVATLNDDRVVNELVAMGPLIGGLTVKVVDVEHAEAEANAEAVAEPAGAGR